MSEREPWLGDVTEALERRIAAAGACPDFLDVVVRAHELDPEAMPADRIDEADALVAALEDETDLEPGSAGQEAALDDWLGDVRSAVERRVDEQREQPRPPLPVQRDRRGAWWLAGMALAAAIVLVLGISQLVGVLAEGGSGQRQENQAQRLQQPSGTTGTVEVVEPEPDPPRARMAPRPEVEHEAIVIPEPEPEPVIEEPASRPKPRRTKEERLRALADQAQAHWRAGRRDEAQRLFERIVREGGRSRAAQMAYADLFTLASQSGNVSVQRKRWKAYLKTFKRGRFADDARAGLCRTAKSSEQPACWTRYLEDFPRGSFRAEARAAKGAP